MSRTGKQARGWMLCDGYSQSFQSKFHILLPLTIRQAIIDVLSEQEIHGLLSASSASTGLEDVIARCLDAGGQRGLARR
jgi:hypothetical protein